MRPTRLFALLLLAAGVMSEDRVAPYPDWQAYRQFTPPYPRGTLSEYAERLALSCSDVRTCFPGVSWSTGPYATHPGEAWYGQCLQPFYFHLNADESSAFAFCQNEQRSREVRMCLRASAKLHH